VLQKDQKANSKVSKGIGEMRARDFDSNKNLFRSITLRRSIA
jgi:hypothetical protein